MRVDRSLAAAAAVGVCGVAFFVLIVVVAHSFRHAIADISDSEMRVTIVDANGSVVYDTDAVGGNHAEREEIRRAFAEGSGTSLRHSETLDRDFLYCARRVGDRVVRLAFPYTGVLRSERLVCMGLIAAGLVGALIVVFVFQLTQRLARRLADRERQLVIVTENERFRREFTSNVTHELKSPITAILSAVEMLGDGSRLSEDERRELFDIIHGECQRLGSLAGDVLSLAQVEREESLHSGDFAELPLEELVTTVVSQLRPKARAAHIRLTLVRNDAVRVKGDALRLEEVLQNLIDNAIRYSGSDRIEVSSKASEGRVEVCVSDFGVGIPPEHLPHVFERFYRVNKSRSRALGGTGLGLAIVKHVVQLHGGTVSVRSVPGVRTDFILRLDQAVRSIRPH